MNNNEELQPAFSDEQIKNIRISAQRWRILIPCLRKQFIEEIMAHGWGKGLSSRSVYRKLESLVGKVHRPNRVARPVNPYEEASANKWKSLPRCLREAFIDEIQRNGWGTGISKGTIRRKIRKIVGKVNRTNRIN